ncbi:MAG: hypothetical protein O3B13_09140 [Planctomycetota bacterium]|nr:hypothetical protein [Planctomycetota bacterium]
MSEAVTESAVEQPSAVAPEPLFSKADIREFESEDSSAGRIICKMLSILFIYTLIAMSIVSYWTSVQN